MNNIDTTTSTPSSHVTPPPLHPHRPSRTPSVLEYGSRPGGFEGEFPLNRTVEETEALNEEERYARDGEDDREVDENGNPIEDGEREEPDDGAARRPSSGPGSSGSTLVPTAQDNMQTQTQAKPAGAKAIEHLDPNEDHTLPLRPWRRRITPWSVIANHHYPGAGTEQDPYIVDWIPGTVSRHGEQSDAAYAEKHAQAGAGPSKQPPTDAIDRANPLTYPSSYKWRTVMAVALATLAVALTSSCLSGAEASIETTFPGYQIDVYILVTSGFVLGFVVGPLLWAPLSELFGRRYLFIGTYIGFTCFNAGVVGSHNIWTLIILRFLAGTFGSSPLTNAGGTVADVFDARKRGLGMAVFSAAPFMGPVLGPIIGGFLGENAGWRWVAGFLAMFTALLTILGTLLIPETYAPKLLKDRAKLLSKTTGKVYRYKTEAKGKIQPKQLFKTALSKPWALLFMEPIVFLLSLYLAIVYGTLYMLFAAFPIIFQQERGWTPGLSGLAFLGVFVGFMGAVLWTIFIENPRYDRKLEANGGWLAPEERLVPAMLGGCLLPIGLFTFAWTAAPATIHWSACIILSAPFGMGMVLVFLSVFNYLIDSYLLYAASVLAANSVLRSLFGVAFPLFTTQMYANLGINWASTLVGFLALLCTPMPFLFRIYGDRVRRKTRAGREADDLGQMMKQMAMRSREKKPVEGVEKEKVGQV